MCIGSPDERDSRTDGGAEWRRGPRPQVLGMPGELFVEYQLAAQRMAAEAGAGGAAAEVMMAAYADNGPGCVHAPETTPR